MHIGSIAALEGVIGKTPPPVNLKVIDHMDANALRWLAVSPLAFAGFGGGVSIAITLAGGAPGFASGEARELRLPVALLDDPALAREGASFCSLFLAPGVGETLRVNGRVAAVADGIVRVAVEECYLHCAKALIRSAFWSAAATTDVPAGAADFIAASRFMALATSDGKGGADLSPKGDPAGSMACLVDGVLWYADRPGNRRADSHRNIIAQPRVALALLIPGSARVAIVTGSARLTTDEDARARFAVQDKTPLLAAQVDDLAVELRDSPALGRARLWPLENPVAGIDAASIFAAHVKLNKGFLAKVAGVLAVPELLRKGLDADYKNNLY
jgi:predicted pyridoxine 5'-phosphate oxidase superfamily flavin-nucleotide-binding protein